MDEWVLQHHLVLTGPLGDPYAQVYAPFQASSFYVGTIIHMSPQELE
jgi:hypothetical protein